MAQNLQLDPQTGDYILKNGRPVEDDSLNTPAYIRLKTRRTKWLYAPDTDFGADYYLYSKRHVPSDDKALVAVTNKALQPLIDSGRATAVSSVVQATHRDRVLITTQVTQAGGTVVQLTFSPLTN